MKIGKLCLLVAATFWFPQAFAQVAPDTATGLSPYAEYTPSQIDNVNPVNGNVFLKLPLASFPQRGGKLRLDYSVYYNDKQWQVANHTFAPIYPCGSPYNGCGSSGNTYGGSWQLGGASSNANAAGDVAGAYVARDQYVQFGSDYWSFQQPYGAAAYSAFTFNTTITNFYVVSSDGAKHYIGDSWGQSCTKIGGGAICPTPPPQTYYDSYPASDGSGFDDSHHDAEGITYTPQSGGLPSIVSDPNGNQILASSTGLTDTLGHVIPGSQAGPGTSAFTGVHGYGGDLIPGVAVTPDSNCPAGTNAEREWTVPASGSYQSGSATYFLCYTNYSYSTAFDVSTVLPNTSTFAYAIGEDNSSSDPNGKAQMLTAVVLPDGNSYTFVYDQYLSLTKLGLPTGGTISYTWQNLAFTRYYEFTSSPISRALKTRTVNPGDGQPPITSTYHWYITPSTGTGTGV
jgi:hypothetical protein